MKFIVSAWDVPRPVQYLIFALALSVVALPCAAQNAFGQPIVKPDRGTVVVESVQRPPQPVVVHVPDAVSKTQRALADITATDASGAQVVTLPYGEHTTYDIPIRNGMFATLQIPQADTIEKIAFTNMAAVELNVEPSTNVAMVKLRQPITVMGTIVGKQHIYYIQITPALGDDPWYQGVSWSFGNNFTDAATFDAYTNPGSDSAVANAVPQGGNSQAGDPSNDLFTGQPNFDYDWPRKSVISPLSVWDNGRFTWIQFPKNMQVLPVVLAKGPNGLEEVNYTVHDDGTQILVPRLMSAFVLRVGKTEVEVKAKVSN
jgi:type IV secretion system protein TrbG